MNNDTKDIGTKIRQLRQEKGITLNEMADKTGVTASLLSQIERNLTNGSISTIKKITSVLGTTVSSLFNEVEADLTESETQETVTIVRKSNRKELSYPSPESTIDYLLTGLGGKLQIIYSKIEPGGGTEEPYSHEADEECIVVQHGMMKIKIADKTYILNEGDTITFSSRLPHAVKNVGEDALEVLFVTTPPGF